MINLMALTLIIGPMKSGKSLELIARLSPYEYTANKIILFQPQQNVRDVSVVSRSGLKKDSIKVHSLAEVVDTPEDVIGIDEVNMFEVSDAKVIEQWLLAGKELIISGLDLDYKREIMPIIAELYKLKPEIVIDRVAVCELCKRYNARFTQVLENNKVVRGGLPSLLPEDGSYHYRPVCRDCYDKD